GRAEGGTDVVCPKLEIRSRRRDAPPWWLPDARLVSGSTVELPKTLPSFRPSCEPSQRSPSPRIPPVFSLASRFVFVGGGGGRTNGRDFGSSADEVGAGYAFVLRDSCWRTICAIAPLTFLLFAIDFRSDSLRCGTSRAAKVSGVRGLLTRLSLT